jgi:transglutaminase-like putative cysteine protease
MGWLDWLFGTGKINELNLKIQAQNQIIQNYADENKNLEDELSEDKVMLEATLKTVKSMGDEIKFLKEPNYVPCPEWLDTTVDVYKPTITVVERGNTYNVNISPQDIYAISPTLQKIADEKGWISLTQNQKFYEIWRFVLDRCDYRYDANDSWEYPTTTYYRTFGDCEDTTILFVTMCKLAGVKADSVFNATGWWKMSDGTNIGHSFPIAMNEDGKWYVYETLNSLPTGAKLFKGSNYTGEFGISNWLYAGKIKGANQI